MTKRKTPAPTPPTEVWVSRFLQALRLCHNVTQSADAANVSVATVMLRQQNHPEFRDQIDAAKREAIQRLEGAVFARGISGSQRAAEFYLRAHAPEVYNVPARVFLGGPTGGPLEIDVRGMLDERLAQLAILVDERTIAGNGHVAPGLTPGTDSKPE